MKAFIVDRYGKMDGVRIGEMPDPEVRENDVLVQVHAAAVNLLDSKIRNGEFKLILPYRLLLILGNDVADLRRKWAFERQGHLQGEIEIVLLQGEYVDVARIRC